MSYNFPISPTENQEFTPPGGVTYVWKTPRWLVSGLPPDSGGGAATSIDIAPPASPTAGQLWWDSDSGRLYIFYDDGNTSQWVEVVPPVGASKDYVDDNFLPLSGGTVTGLTYFQGGVAAGATSGSGSDPNPGTILGTTGLISSKRAGTGSLGHYAMYNNAAVTPTLIGYLATNGGYTVLSNETSGTGILLRPTNAGTTVGQVEISPSGDVTVKGAVIFPATQVASTDPNALDDYEEGNWSPFLQFGGASTGITYGTRVATYTKIGRLVIAMFDVPLTSKGTSVGAATIDLPFTATGTGTAMFGYWAAMANITSGSLIGYVAGSTCNIRIGGVAGIVNAADTNFTNTTRFIGTMAYQAA